MGAMARFSTVCSNKKLCVVKILKKVKNVFDRVNSTCINIVNRRKVNSEIGKWMCNNPEDLNCMPRLDDARRFGLLVRY